MAGEPAQIGPYQIGKRIGQGGMGAVYEAVHETIGRRAAVKFLNAGLARHPSTLNRFFNEARAVSLVEHPGLVQIYDSGQLPDGPAYIIMELIRGETLGDRLKRERRLPLLQTLRLGWQMADTLAAVHEKEIVHRDIKPANLMIVPDPAATGRERLKILDFGIAKLASGIGAGDTRPGQVMGSPVYMAPEQCRGAAGVDSKADAYAVGAVLYHMMAGQPPFDGETFAALVFKHLHEPLIPLTERGVDAPAKLIDCVHALLQKDPKLRPSMREAATQLEALLADVQQQQPSPPVEPAASIPPISAARPVVGDGVDTTRVASDLVSTLGQSVGQTPAQRWRPSRGVLGAGAAGLLILGLLVALLWPKGSPDSRQAGHGRDATSVGATASTVAGIDPAAASAQAKPSGTSGSRASSAAVDRPSASGSSAKVAGVSPPPVAANPAPKPTPSEPKSKPASTAKPAVSKPSASSASKRRPAASKGSKSLGTKKSFPIIQ